MHLVHDKIAEKYDDDNSQREFSNKFAKYRRTLLSYADGRVLEMGVGTGANLAFYSSETGKESLVTEVVGVDWSANMLMQAFGKLDDLKRERTNLPKITFLQADCQHLSQFQDDSFDCVVDTLTLHSTYDRKQHCAEMQRLCRPGGHILLMQRGASYLSVYN